MADANDVQAPDITPEDFMADEQESDQTDSSPVKEDAKADAEKDPEVEKDADEESKGDDTPDDKKAPPKPDGEDDDEEDKPDADNPDDKDSPLDEEKPLAPKSENRFQRLANENRQLREQVEKMTAEVYKAQTVDELTDMVNPDTGEVYTRAEAAVASLEQRLQMKEFNEQITNTRAVLGAESYEILQEMPMFNPDSKEYDEELAEIAAETLEANLVRDPNIPEIDPATGKPTGRGVVVDYHRSPKQIYSKLAKIHAASETKGRQRGQQDTEEMLANADGPPSNAPPAKKKDPLADLWSEPL